MNIKDLIETLKDYAETYGEDTEVRIAEQPHWPFENEIAQVEIVNLAEETCDVCSGSKYEDEGVLCGNCDGTGKYRDEQRTNKEEGDEWIVYLGEGSQIGYLPGIAREMLGWGRE